MRGIKSVKSLFGERRNPVNLVFCLSKLENVAFSENGSKIVCGKFCEVGDDAVRRGHQLHYDSILCPA